MLEHKILETIQASDNIAIVTHVSPDGDALGSTLALQYALKSMGKDADMFCQDVPPPTYDFLKEIELFKKPENRSSQYSLCIAVDCSDIYRMGLCRDIFESASATINIDHHISNNNYAVYNLVDSKASATGEIIYRLLKLMNVKINKSCAEALYTAISTDTGSFNYNNVSAETYRIAADLIDLGVDVERTTKILFRTSNLQKVMLLKETLNTLELYKDNKVAILHITREMFNRTGSVESDAENMVNYAISIKGVEIGILIREIDDNYVKVSFRSAEKADVSKLASLFDGGGHKKAAGATINLTVENTKKALIEAITENAKELL